MRRARQLQCQPTTREVYTPNIPNFYFKPENAVAFSSGDEANLTTLQLAQTYILPLPPVSALSNCRGAVTSVQFCYTARQEDLSRAIPVFTILSQLQGEPEFVVGNPSPIESTPQDRDSSGNGTEELICCDQITPTSDQFAAVSIYGLVLGVPIRNYGLLAITGIPCRKSVTAIIW